MILVIRLLAAVMEQASTTTTTTTSTSGDTHHNDFYNTGRVGRRNALPDILHHCTTSTADLPDKLTTLTLTSNESTSNTQAGSNADHANTSPELMNNT